MPELAYVIAGSEAAGSAGIQVDLKTFQQLGVYGLGTLTCIVSVAPRNDWAHRFVPIDARIIADQIEAATAAHDLHTVKVGMLGTPETIDVVSAGLRSQEWRDVVVDPVLICKGQEPGAALDTDNALREQILPLATVVTPNLFETTALAGVESITTVEELTEAARRIRDLGPTAVVAKGGTELPGPDAVDVLVHGDDVVVLREPKIGQERVNGAGCTLAAAITAELAKGAELEQAVRTGKAVVTAGIEARVRGNTPFSSVWQGAYRG